MHCCWVGGTTVLPVATVEPPPTDRTVHTPLQVCNGSPLISIEACAEDADRLCRIITPMVAYCELTGCTTRAVSTPSPRNGT